MRRGASRSSIRWRGPGRWLGRWLAVGLAVALGRAEAWAQPCSAPTPACHLENGTELLTSDPRRAAEELLASYQLDERTDTLALYATALALDHRHALALDTWKRVIVFRDGELEAAREAARTSTGRKRAAARATVARAQKQSEQAAEAIIQLWARVGRVRIRLAPGQQVAVTRDGAPVDPAQDVIVNAGGDELVFTHRDGRVERVPVQVAAGAFVKIDAPAAPAGTSSGPAVVTRAPQPRERETAAPVAATAGAGSPARPVATRADGGKPTTPPDAAVATAARPRTAPVAATSSALDRPADAVVVASTRPRPVDPPAATPARPAASAAAVAVAPTRPGRPADPSVVSPKPEPVRAVAPDAADDADADAAAVPRPALAADRADSQPRWLTVSRIGLGLVAGAVIAGGVAGSYGYLAGRDFDSARAAGCSDDGRCPFGPAADLAQQSNDRARIAQISAVSAVALAATGATLWWVGRGRTHPTVTDVALHVGPSTASGGVSTAISGRF